MSIIAQSPQTKTCNQCGIEKPMLEFRTNSNGRGIGGRRAQCGDCERVYQRTYYKKNHTEILLKNRTDEVNKKQRERLRRYRQTNKGKQVQKNNHAKRKAQFPEKPRAKDAVNNAIKAGKLPPISTKTCTRCGVQANHYHHWSYKTEYHLDVIPVCRPCHVTIHQRHPLHNQPQEATA